MEKQSEQNEWTTENNLLWLLLCSYKNVEQNNIHHDKEIFGVFKEISIHFLVTASFAGKKFYRASIGWCPYGLERCL